MLADLGADGRRVLGEMVAAGSGVCWHWVASVVAAIGAGLDSVGRWVDRLAAGSGRVAVAMGDGLKTWAAQVRQQATGRHASRQAGSVRAGRLCAAGADWAMWLGAAELGLRPWWSGDGVRTGKSR